MRLLCLFATLAAGVTAAGCGVGTIVNGGEGRASFERDIAPILERDCGSTACHAAEGDLFDQLNPEYFVFPVDANGSIAGSGRMSDAYQRAVEKLAYAGAEFSDFIRKPLDESLGGLPHRGGVQYRTMSDETLDTLLRWANQAKPTSEEPLPPLVQAYADTIQPVLAEKRCMLASCHGAGASNLVIFDPGVLGVFDRNATMRNYNRIILHLNLETPDPMMSRLIRKTTPQDQGGIFHRGGNDFFNPAANDTNLEAIKQFMQEGREALGDTDKGVATGIVFAATDPTPRKRFEFHVWQPGGDIYSLIPATPTGVQKNLTATHHTGPADVRDPAVNYDGTKVAFAMRRDLDDCLNIYTMNLDGSGLVQITHDTGLLPNGIKVSNVEPLWGPDDRIYFTSSREGVYSAHSPIPNTNIWRIDADGSHPLRMSFNPANEASPAWRFFPAKGPLPELRTLDLTFTAIRGVGDTMLAPLMRVPPDFRADYHPHFGTQNPNYHIFTSMTQLPDFREPLILADDSTVWEGGALALIDRNLGPVITDGNSSAVVNYVDPLVPLGTIGEEITAKGVSRGGYYRDPHAMPDGSIVVSQHSQNIDQADPNATPDTALYRLTLEDFTGNRIVVARKELLVNLPGKIETDPRPIFKKRREIIGDPLEHLSNDRTDGEMMNFDLAVALTVAKEDSPSGIKDFQAMADSFSYVRLVEEVAQTPAVSASEIGRGGHGMRRVLAEFPATSDRSVFVNLPAGVPFFIQALDDSMRAVATFNQWFFVLPGERLLQVTRREVWNNRCGACHGSVSGIPGDTVGTPDVLTEASRVVANYDPIARKDLPPLPFGLTPQDRPQVDFVADVQPILTAACATSGCHDGTRIPNLTARAGVSGFSGAYEALTASGTFSANGFSYVDPRGSSARSSYLAEVISGEELDAPRAMDSDGCGGPQRLSADQRSTLVRWMDMGASFRGAAPMTLPQLPVY